MGWQFLKKVTQQNGEFYKRLKYAFTAENERKAGETKKRGREEDLEYRS